MQLTPEEWETLTTLVGLTTDAAATAVIDEVRKLVEQSEEMADKLGDIAQALVSSPSGANQTPAPERLSWI